MFPAKNTNRNDARESLAAVVSINAADLAELVTRTSGDGLFRYVDGLLRCIGPAVEEYRGRLVSVSQSGVSAVFEQSCEDALLSSVTVCQRIASNPNEHFRFADFAVGISYGTVYTDQVGYGSFRVPLTISECTRAAGRLQSAAGKYNAHILIGESAAAQIPDFHTKFNTRCLGRILSRDTGEAQPFYDVFDGDPIDVKNSKRRSKLFFETGVRLFEEKKYDTARSHFIEIIKSDRGDRAAKEYLYACDSIMSGETEEIQNIEIW